MGNLRNSRVLARSTARGKVNLQLKLLIGHSLEDCFNKGQQYNNEKAFIRFLHQIPYKGRTVDPVTLGPTASTLPMSFKISVDRPDLIAPKRTPPCSSPTAIGC